jgi:Tfp pilus assembly protein PilZ
MYMQTASQERRKHSRNTPRTLIRITFSPVDDSQQFLGLINDVSNNGIGISSPSRFLAGTILDVTINDRPDKGPLKANHVVGKVCWCAPDAATGDTFNIGVETLGEATGRTMLW